MITTEGKLWVRQFLPSGGQSLATSIAIGVGGTTETLADTKLQFEITRVPVDIISFDHVNNLLIFKGTVPASIAGKIYEIGLYTQPINTVANGYGSQLLIGFDSIKESWTTAVWETTNYRIGFNSMRQTQAASASSTATLNQGFDLSGYSGADKFVLAYNVENAFTASMRIRFLQDGSNYFDINLGAQTAGYKVTEVAKSTATTTGNPAWSAITSVQVTSTSTAGGASAVSFDGLRIEDVDSLNPEYLMLARKVVTPIVKELGINREFEYGVPITL